MAPGAHLNFSLLRLYKDEEQRLARAPVEPHLPVFLGATPTPGENLFFCFGFFFLESCRQEVTGDGALLHS